MTTPLSDSSIAIRKPVPKTGIHPNTEDDTNYTEFLGMRNIRTVQQELEAVDFIYICSHVVKYRPAHKSFTGSRGNSHSFVRVSLRVRVDVSFTQASLEGRMRGVVLYGCQHLGIRKAGLTGAESISIHNVSRRG